MQIISKRKLEFKNKDYCLPLNKISEGEQEQKVEEEGCRIVYRHIVQTANSLETVRIAEQDKTDLKCRTMC